MQRVIVCVGVGGMVLTLAGGRGAQGLRAVRAAGVAVGEEAVGFAGVVGRRGALAVELGGLVGEV